MNVFLFYGSYGSPNENWLPWIKSKLEEKGIKVFIPEFPTPENQNLENWLKVFEKYSSFIDEESIFIGHSLGGTFILDILEKMNKKIKAGFLVAGFTGKIGIEEFDKINKTIADKEFDWNKINKNCEKFFVFYSDNDPYVPIKKAEYLLEKLNAEEIFVKGAGHFNKKFGYEEFPLLLEKIETV